MPTQTFTSKIALTSKAANIEEEIHKLVGWKPWMEVYVQPTEEVSYEITKLVANCRSITFSIEQIPEVNVFTADSVTIEVKNYNQLFDPDSANNLFNQYGYVPTDGYQCPIKIKGGYILSGTKELLFLFHGLITKISLTSDSDKASINAMDQSAKLRKDKADDMGILHENVSLYGGSHYTQTTDSITENNRTIPASTDGFPEWGIIQITSYSGDTEQVERVYYSGTDSSNFKNCIRAYLDYESYSHDSGAVIEPVLMKNRRVPNKREFQFPYYPISKKSLTSLSSSDGDIEIVPSCRKVGQLSNLRATVDWNNGVLEIEKAPADPTSLTATWKSCYKQRKIDYLVKKLFLLADFSEDELSNIEPASLQDWQNREWFTYWGRP